jgi:hypothetical protein
LTEKTFLPKLPIMDEAIEHFMAFTGASSEVARRYLAFSDGNPEQAIQLFFDSPDLASGVDSQPSAPPVPNSTRPQPRSTSVGREDSRGIVHLDDDEGGMDIDDSDDEAARAAALSRAADVEDDEAMARRMQEELYAGGDASGGFDADGVRAPIARRTETLVGGPDSDWNEGHLDAGVAHQMRRRMQGGGSSSMSQSQGNIFIKC